MYILLEGMFGTWGASRGFLAVAAGVGPACLDSGRDGEAPGVLPIA